MKITNSQGRVDHLPTLERFLVDPRVFLNAFLHPTVTLG